MSKRVIYKNCSLCWSCKNAVPTAVQDPRTGERKYTQGCAWSIYRQPVKGWDAEKSEMKVNDRICPTYYVNDCPEYVKGRH